MKAMIVGVFTPNSTTIWQAKGFKNIGLEIITYDYRQKLMEIGRLRTKKEIVYICREEKPDFILYVKCNRVRVETITETNKICPSAFWYMDNIWGINEELILKMKECNYVFCSRYDGIDEAKKHNNNTYFLQEGYDPSIHHPIETPYIRDVAFIGSVRRRYRKRFAQRMNFDVFTNSYGLEHSKIVSETKINLNFSEGDGTSNRTYKILAAKGFLLTQPWKGIEDDWEIGKHLDTFNNQKELSYKIQYYLENDKKREEIAEAGYQHVKQYDNNNFARRITDMVTKNRV